MNQSTISIEYHKGGISFIPDDLEWVAKLTPSVGSLRGARGKTPTEALRNLVDEIDKRKNQKRANGKS